MPFELNLDPSDLIIDRYIPDIRPIFPRPAKVRILIVLEPGISPGPPGSGFGLGRVVSYLRNESFGFVNFEVDFALRGTDDSPTAVDIDNGAGEWDFRYRDFRYHSVEDGTPILHGYDELWCFGINPNIHDNGDNQSVKDSEYSSTPAELTVLTARSTKRVLRDRYRKFRKMGEYSSHFRVAFTQEVAHLQGYVTQGVRLIRRRQRRKDSPQLEDGQEKD